MSPTLGAEGGNLKTPIRNKNGPSKSLFTVAKDQEMGSLSMYKYLDNNHSVPVNTTELWSHPQQ